MAKRKKPPLLRLLKPPPRPLKRLLLRLLKPLLRLLKPLLRLLKPLLRPLKPLLRPLKPLLRPLKPLLRPLKPLLRPLKKPRSNLSLLSQEKPAFAGFFHFCISKTEESASNQIPPGKPALLARHGNPFG